MSKLIILAIVIALIYATALSPQMRSKVNEKATNSVKELGTMAVDKIKGTNNETPPIQGNATVQGNLETIDFGKPNCQTSQDCTQFGSNVTCQASTGHCIRG